MTARSGFTLVELSLVLVIIGLIVGGILVGQDLIRAAEIRATVAQIDKYNTAVNAFQVKYGFIPGDLPSTKAAQLGFFAETTNGGDIGHQDGNGLVVGGNGFAPLGYRGVGEIVGFWRHLTDSAMLDGNYGTAVAGNDLDPATGRVTTALTPGNASTIFPLTKLGRGNHLIAYADNGFNYFMMAAIGGMTVAGTLTLDYQITPIEGQNIDTKMDDGTATFGNVTAYRQTYMPGGFAPFLLGGASCTAGNRYDVDAAADVPNCQLILRFK